MIFVNMDEHLPPIPIDDEYEEILNTIREAGGEINYKDLNEKLGDKFEGVRLRLKTMKEKGMVSFDGMVPGFSAIISLSENTK